MDESKLIAARKYYELTHYEGKTHAEAMKLVVKGATPGSLRHLTASEEYSAVVSMAHQAELNELKRDIVSAQKRKLRAYNKLLDKGEELMEEASTTEEKIMAQTNQRANLGSTVVSEAVGWNGDNRNQTGDDVLEGIIIQ